MSFEDQWLKEIQSLEKQISKPPFLQNLSLESIAFYDENAPPRILPPVESGAYWNIVESQPTSLTDEFLQSQNAALLLRDSYPSLKDLVGVRKIYCSPTVGLTPQKQALLDMDSFEMNLGLDVYSLGLWQSKLFRTPSVDKKLSLNRHRIFRLSSMSYEMAGANEIQELAVLLSSLVQLVEDYKGDFSTNEMLELVSLELSIQANTLVSCTKIQALRLLLVRLILEEWKIEDSIPPIFCTPSLRHLGTREPWTNIMRLTAMNMAARMGGASGMINFAFDLYSKNDHSDENRISRNLDLILQNESYIGKIQDPNLGSYSLDLVTTRLCELAWELYLEIRHKEGLLNALTSGWLQSLIKVENQKQVDRLFKGQMRMIGVNKHALNRSLSKDDPLVRQEETIDIETWWTQYANTNSERKLCDVQKLTPIQLSSFFEKWQFQSDKIREKDSSGAVVFLVIEPGQEESSKIQSVKEVLAAAALEVKTCREDLIKAPVHVLVSSDPNGEFAQKMLKWHREANPKGLFLWAGEKTFEGFDGIISLNENPMGLYEKIFKVLGEF